MIRLYLAGGVIVAFAALGGLAYTQHKQLDAKTAEITRLKDEKAALEESAKSEAQIQTVTRTIYRTVEKVKHEIASIDPQCGNEGELVGGWSAGIDRVREAAAKPDHSPAVSLSPVPFTRQVERADVE